MHAGNADFSTSRLLQTQLLFSPNINRACANISIVDDELVEEIEVFSLILNTTSEGVSFSPLATVITIVDNDSKYMQLS